MNIVHVKYIHIAHIYTYVLDKPLPCIYTIQYKCIYIHNMSPLTYTTHYTYVYIYTYTH